MVRAYQALIACCVIEHTSRSRCRKVACCRGIEHLADSLVLTRQVRADRVVVLSPEGCRLAVGALDGAVLLAVEVLVAAPAFKESPGCQAVAGIA